MPNGNLAEEVEHSKFLSKEHNFSFTPTPPPFLWAMLSILSVEY